MKFINKMRKKEKGFTLVEIIVVLVILAILAAFTIPTMLGFVNDAKGKALIAEAREVYVAAQATATEYNATHSTALGSTDLESTKSNAGVTQIVSYVGSDIDNSTWKVELDGTKVKKVEYKKDGYTVTIDKSASGTGAIVTKP